MKKVGCMISVVILVVFVGDLALVGYNYWKAQQYIDNVYDQSEEIVNDSMDQADEIMKDATQSVDDALEDLNGVE